MTAALAAAQAPEKVVQKIIEVRHADPDRVANALRIFGVTAASDRNLHMVSVRGTAESVAAAEDAVKKLDIAPVNVELAVYLLNGSPDAKQGGDEGIPTELASTVKQLRTLFTYKGYRLTESFVLRGRDGAGANTSGSIPNANQTYEFRYRSASVSAGSPRVVHVDDMMLLVSTPTRAVDKDNQIIYRRAQIGTNLDAAEGQKIVVGKSNTNGTDDAMILVVTAKIVQ
jgi:hypothetical protein